MKLNQPVGYVERILDPGRPIVTKTDLKGRITYTNDAFVNLSGFSRSELLGASHNIVRHPDMPREAFADLWRTIQAGYAWRGVVKNWAKGGDFYWVNAFVTPILRDGNVIGYMSVRHAPTRAQIASAESLYREVSAGRSRFAASVIPYEYSPMRWAIPLATMTIIAFAGFSGESVAWLWGGVAGAVIVFLGGAFHWLVQVPARRVTDVVLRLDEGRLGEKVAGGWRIRYPARKVGVSARPSTSCIRGCSGSFAGHVLPSA